MSFAAADHVARALPDLTVELLGGLGARDLERACRRAWRLGDVGHRAVAFYLEQMQETGLHQKLGFSSAAHFARSRLGMAPRTARELIAIGRALLELEKVDAAFAARELCWTQVRLLVRVATPETESAWIERAREVSTERLEREVRGGEKGRPPRADGKGLPEVRYTVRVKVDGVTHELWEQARRRLSAESETELSEAEALRSLAEHVLRAGGADAPERARDSVFRVVIDRCPGCRSASVRTDAGPDAVPEAQADAIACDAPAQVADRVREDAAMPLPFGLDRPTDRALRTRVLARDGFRCRCCRSRRDLSAHHIVFRSHGGPTTMRNLITLCVRCHALVHDGKLRVAGAAPHAVTVTSADGRPVEDVRTEGAEVRRSLETGREDGDGPGAPRRETVTFDRLPRSVPAAWWREHRHLFAWHERKGVLGFTDGAPRPPRRGVAGEGGADAPSGNRPARFDGMIGQQRIVRNLELAVEAARARRGTVDHVLLHGPPGLGKTTLARAVATETGTRLHATSAPLLTDVGQLVGLLATVADRDVVLIDEIHRLPARVCEVLYEALEDGCLGLPIAQGTETRTLRVELPRLTVIGATTDPDRLPRPLVDRFGLVAELESYGAEDLAAIARRAADGHGIVLDEEAAAAVARAARGTPRIALKLVDRVRDLVAARPRPCRPLDRVREALDLLGLDADGLGPRHQQTLRLVRHHGRLGRARLAGLLQLSRGAVRDLIEPPLLALGLLRATPRGLAIA